MEILVGLGLLEVLEEVVEEVLALLAAQPLLAGKDMPVVRVLLLIELMAVLVEGAGVLVRQVLLG